MHMELACSAWGRQRRRKRHSWELIDQISLRCVELCKLQGSFSSYLVGDFVSLCG